MTRLRGRCPKSRRLRFACPHGHWRTTTMLGAVRLDGTTAAMAIEGPTDTCVFQAYVRKVLLPLLRPGDIVVMDNLAPHKNEQALEWIAQAGVQVLFLPPYSPDLNPIEMMWSKIKALLRKAAARTHEELLSALSSALSKVTASDARGWFNACGYSII
jgi:transposase